MDEPTYRDQDLLRRTVEPGAGADRFWDENDFGAILRHQLDAPLALDLQSVGRVEAAAALELGATATPPIGTFREAVLHPAPPLPLLRLIKRLAEAELHAPERGLPHPVALLLYDCAIVAARLRCGERITGLPDDKLVESLTWLLSEPWLEPDARDLLVTGLASLDARLAGSGAVPPVQGDVSVPGSSQ